jgi:hypothetical protein
MGTLYLSLAFSGYLAGLIAKLTASGATGQGILGFFITYRNIGLLTLIIAVVIYCLSIVFN